MLIFQIFFSILLTVNDYIKRIWIRNKWVTVIMNLLLQSREVKRRMLEHVPTTCERPLWQKPSPGKISFILPFFLMFFFYFLKGNGHDNYLTRKYRYAITAEWPLGIFYYFIFFLDFICILKKKKKFKFLKIIQLNLSIWQQ